MEKLLKEPILIIKTSCGGKSLHTDFRPPSAGPYVVSQRSWDGAKQHGEDLKAIQDRVDKTPRGISYRLMSEHVRRVLADIGRVVPEYDPNNGYELAGFVWFQGLNDMIDEWTYDDRMNGGYGQYSQLLEHFIRDVRKDMSAPKMPFVIGIMGIDGVKAGPPQSYFREFQAAPAWLPEFRGNVVAVLTAPFWDDDLEALQERAEKNEKLTPEEEKRLKAGVSNGGYHYLGAAKIMAPIGKAFAEPMANLQKPQRQKWLKNATEVSCGTENGSPNETANKSLAFCPRIDFPSMVRTCI